MRKNLLTASAKGVDVGEDFLSPAVSTVERAVMSFASESKLFSPVNLGFWETHVHSSNPPLSQHFAGFMHANILPQVRGVNVGLGKGGGGNFAET